MGDPGSGMTLPGDAAAWTWTWAAIAAVFLILVWFGFGGSRGSVAS